MQSRLTRINDIISKGVFLFGAGANGSWCLDYLHRENINVIGFIDSSADLQGKILDGITVYSYEDYCKSYSNYAVLITAKHCAGTIFEQYKDNQLMAPFDAWFANLHYDEYKQLVFDDDRSYYILNTILDCMKKGDNTEIANIAEANQYFGVPRFYYYNTSKTVFVDLGACTGDTIERYLFSEMGAVQKIYAFEPGKKQIKALKARSKRLTEEWALEADTIEIVEACVGATDSEVPFNNNDNTARTRITARGEDMIRQVTLDSFFNDQDVSFIKTDIEGSDYDALCGAEKLIKRCKPKLAISVYHKPDDLLRIYRLINGWDIGYKFMLRQHSSRLMETTLYCW